MDESRSPREAELFGRIVRDEALTGSVHAPQRPRTDAKKLELIAYIVDVQTQHQNDEDGGDRNLADAYMAMEAIECVLNDTTSGALRQYTEAGQ